MVWCGLLYDALWVVCICYIYVIYIHHGLYLRVLLINILCFVHYAFFIGSCMFTWLFTLFTFLSFSFFVNSCSFDSLFSSGNILVHFSFSFLIFDICSFPSSLCYPFCLFPFCSFLLIVYIALAIVYRIIFLHFHNLSFLFCSYIIFVHLSHMFNSFLVYFHCMFFFFCACVYLLTFFSVHSFVISFNVLHLFLLSSSFSSLFPNHPFSPSSPLSFPFSFSSLLYKRTHPSLPAPFDPIRTMLTLPNGGIPPL